MVSRNHPDWESCSDTQWEVGHGGTANADGLSPLFLSSDIMLAYISALKGGQKVLETWSMAWPTMLKLMTAATVTQLWCYSRKVTKESLCPGRKCWEASPAARSWPHLGLHSFPGEDSASLRERRFRSSLSPFGYTTGVVSYLVMSQLRKRHASS